MIDGHWMPCRDADLRALALVERHYSERLKKRRAGGRRHTGFVGPGQKMVLLTRDCRAVFAWLRPVIERKDGQQGACCVVFRNEGPVLSSVLVGEADDLAWVKWPGDRHFTFVDPASVASRNPGYCFIRAGWRRCGKTRRGLFILERLPVADEVTS